MKKTIIMLMAAAAVFTACQTDNSKPKAPETNAETQAEEPEKEEAEDESSYVTVTGSDGIEAVVIQNPKTVAIYDYAILDTLNSIGFEKTGIEKLVVPAKDNLPQSLEYFKSLSDDKVVSGGTLFYIDWDVLDLVQPEVVVLGGRSFRAGASGERFSEEEAEKYQSDTYGRYADTAFVKLSMNTSDSQLLSDMENNVNALSEIFPEMKEALENRLSEVKAKIEATHDKAAASGKTALFCMMVDQNTLSVFNPNSRFDMIYEEFGFTPVDQDATSWTDQHGFDVRAEYVLEKDPDVIFLLDRSATVGSGAGAENFINDPIIAKTQAALNGDIYVLSGDAWYTITGGLSAVETMIDDINQYLDKLN